MKKHTAINLGLWPTLRTQLADPFEGFGVMSAGLQRTIVEALALRHGREFRHE